MDRNTFDSDTFSVVVTDGCDASTNVLASSFAGTLERRTAVPDPRPTQVFVHVYDRDVGGDHHAGLSVY